MKKEIKKGKYTLTHERYIDEMGFEQDSFDLFDEELRIHYPFLGKIKVSDKGKNFPINKIPHNYTKKDYQEMLEEQIVGFKEPNLF
jgi:hypothetical protein